MKVAQPFTKSAGAPDQEYQMALEIVWRNPVPPAKTERRVEPFMVDDVGAVYVIRAADTSAAFELIFGGAA